MLALTTYTFLKFLHVLLAVIAVGFNASYAIWFARAQKDPDHVGFALKGVKILDDRFANPAYGLLLVTGLAMVWVGDLDLTTFWLAAALVLYVIAVLVGALVYTPTLKRQIRVWEEGGSASPELAALSKRGTLIGLLLAVDVIVIVFLMVTKPTL